MRSLESFQQEARLCAEEHAEGERMPQRRRLAFSIFEEQAPRIRHKAVGLRAESVVTAEAAHIFHTPIGRVHAREAPPVHLQRERVEKYCCPVKVFLST